MNNFFFTAMSSPNQGQEAGFASFIPLILIMGVLYFLLIRPNAKKAKAQKNMIANLKKGDKIVTIGGIHGEIKELKETSLVISISSDSTIEMERSSIATVLNITTEDNKKA